MRWRVPQRQVGMRLGVNSGEMKTREKKLDVYVVALEQRYKDIYKGTPNKRRNKPDTADTGRRHRQPSPPSSADTRCVTPANLSRVCSENNHPLSHTICFVCEGPFNRGGCGAHPMASGCGHFFLHVSFAFVGGSTKKRKNHDGKNCFVEKHPAKKEQARWHLPISRLHNSVRAMRERDALHSDVTPAAWQGHESTMAQTSKLDPSPARDR